MKADGGQLIGSIPVLESASPIVSSLWGAFSPVQESLEDVEEDEEDLVNQTTFIQLNHARMAFSIITGYLQVVSQLSNIYSYTLLSHNLREMMWSFSFVNFNITALVNLRCLFYHYSPNTVISLYWLSFWESAIKPLSLGVLFGTLYLVFVVYYRSEMRKEFKEDVRKKIEWQQSAFSGFVGVALFMIMLIHSDVTMVMFQMFNCTRIDLEDPDGAELWLWSDTSIQCQTAAWRGGAIAALVIIVLFTFGLPLSLLVQMRRMRELHLFVMPRAKFEEIRHLLPTETWEAASVIDRFRYQQISWMWVFLGWMQQILAEGIRKVQEEKAETELSLRGNAGAMIPEEETAWMPRQSGDGHASMTATSADQAPSDVSPRDSRRSLGAESLAQLSMKFKTFTRMVTRIFSSSIEMIAKPVRRHGVNFASYSSGNDIHVYLRSSVIEDSEAIARGTGTWVPMRKACLSICPVSTMEEEEEESLPNKVINRSVTAKVAIASAVDSTLLSKRLELQLPHQAAPLSIIAKQVLRRVRNNDEGVPLGSVATPRLEPVTYMESNNNQKIVGQFSLPFRPKFYYWQCVEICRRVLQTGMVVIIGMLCGEAWMIVYGCVVSIVFLSLHLAYSPYSNLSLDKLQTVVLANQFIIQFGIILVSMECADVNTIGIAFLTIQGVAITYVIFLMRETYVPSIIALGVMASKVLEKWQAPVYDAMEMAVKKIKMPLTSIFGEGSKTVEDQDIHAEAELERHVSINPMVLPDREPTQKMKPQRTSTKKVQWVQNDFNSCRNNPLWVDKQ
ncbi:hypothetical protein CYMTET_22319 [Cymbomonas tetramitiformis]|uniref:Uncharacterized protein n=1 Tax=Cymbomonas tetramitiformis TaxID=36881 RepID=A0AAE0G0H5_9CHLO|nr:hypothetical protein CYMTET_22319 [Cymbomonas tetramitiformis]